jgi:nicotinamidase-related amidase
MNVVHFPAPLPRSARPLMCFVDLQVEYIAGNRELALADREPWTSNCRRLLTTARARRLPIAHFRQLRRESLFNQATEFADWIDEFRPRPFEMVFERSKPSCYAAERFADFMRSLTDPAMILVGLTGAGACLATAVESLHRGHRCVFVADASSTPPIGDLGEAASQRIVSELIGTYAEVIPTRRAVEWIDRARESV